VAESVRSYSDGVGYDCVMPEVVFDDSYISGGYGQFDEDIVRCINEVMDNDVIPLNRTYTVKAYRGMTEYVKKNGIEGKNILFIHTGGCPLFFDDMGEE
ncbi:MAG: 1-aminocyclopropane-1-carboxylate deaminase, partial [Clostridia bacterium]|nr:1-aminocyclopropane-1-carboxylate deaminase [Clostridia bacterium]